jgi:colanic acid biosynthesis glycosyl transferase WcaI
MVTHPAHARSGVDGNLAEMRRVASVGTDGKRKVVFVNRYFSPDESATSRMLSDLARELVRRGMTVHVVCSRQLYDDAQANLPACDSVDGVVVHRVWTARMGRTRVSGRLLDYLSFYPAAVTRLLRILRRGDVLVAKTDPPMLSMPALFAARLAGARLVNWLQDLFPEVAFASPQRGSTRIAARILRGLRNVSLRSADFNVLIGARMHDYVLSQGVRTERAGTIENWADGESIMPISRQASSLRNRLGLQDRFVVSYSGNLGHAHECQTLLLAARFMAQDARTVFLMIGGGTKMRTLQRAVETEGLLNFIFLGYQSRETLADSLAAADLHLTSLLPAFERLIVPSKIYGIMAAGRPVIFIGDTSGEIANVIREGRCGSAVECDDGVGLAKAIQRLRDDETLLVQQGSNSRALFEKSYTLQRGTQRWFELLTALQPALSTTSPPSASTMADANGRVAA